MNRISSVVVVAAAASAALTGVAHAGVVPAPLIAAGPAGLAVLAIAGGGYLAVRALRKRR